MSASEELSHEAKEYDVFELVTDALECVDRYERSKDTKCLRLASIKLQNALNIDPHHLKGRYFQAMVNYFLKNTKDAIDQFTKLLDEVKSKPLANEIRYNLAATYSEVPDWANAILLFKDTINDTRDTPELNLLARVGLVKTHAEAKHSDKAEAVAELISAQEVREHYIQIDKILSPNSFRWLLSFIRPKKRINKKVSAKAKELIADARTKEGLKFRRSRLPLVIFIVILFLLVGALIYMTYGVRLQ